MILCNKYFLEIPVYICLTFNLYFIFNFWLFFYLHITFLALFYFWSYAFSSLFAGCLPHRRQFFSFSRSLVESSSLDTVFKVACVFFLLFFMDWDHYSENITVHVPASFLLGDLNSLLKSKVERVDGHTVSFLAVYSRTNVSNLLPLLVFLWFSKLIHKKETDTEFYKIYCTAWSITKVFPNSIPTCSDLHGEDLSSTEPLGHVASWGFPPVKYMKQKIHILKKWLVFLYSVLTLSLWLNFGYTLCWNVVLWLSVPSKTHAEI